jgi:UTP--glucose-1-phosphate uridylyltransferase
MKTSNLKRPVRKAVFPVAGLGTRFLPATKVMPKEMLPINDMPLIQHVVQEAQEAGIEELIFVTGRHKTLLEEHFDYQPELKQTLERRGKKDMLIKVEESELDEGTLFLTRQNRPLGLGHAIWCAHKLIGDEPFAILLPDVLIKSDKASCLKQMVDIYERDGGNIIAVEDVPREETSSYGIVDVESEEGESMVIKGMVEKPKPEDAPSTLSVIGRYILQPEVFEYLEAFETGAGDEIQLTDAMDKLLAEQPFFATRFEGKSYDSGSRLGFIQANMAYAADDPLIGEGVKKSIIEMAEKLKEGGA